MKNNDILIEEDFDVFFDKAIDIETEETSKWYVILEDNFDCLRYEVKESTYDALYKIYGE